MSSSSIRLCFAQESHSIFSLPEGFIDFHNQIREVFHQQLPSIFSLKIQDSNGTLVSIQTLDDYKTFLDYFEASSSEIKVVITSQTPETIHTQDKLETEKEDFEKEERESFDILEEKGSSHDDSDSHDVIDNIDFSEKDSCTVREMTEASIIEEEELESKHIRVENQGDVLETQREIIQTSNDSSLKKSLMEQFIQTENSENQGQNLPLRKYNSNSDRSEIEMSPKFISDIRHFQQNFGMVNEKSTSIRRKSLTLDVPSSYLVSHEPKEDALHAQIENIQSQVKNSDEQIRKVVFDTFSSNLPEFALLVKNYLENSEDPLMSIQSRVPKAVHTHCYCDGCGVLPITGSRFKCSICENFDFCENCEATKEHPHLFLKLTHPKDYSKIIPQKPTILKGENQEFSFQQLGKKIKDTTLVKVLSNTYGQIPDQLVKTMKKVFGSFKNNSANTSGMENFSQTSEDEESGDDEYEYESEEEDEYEDEEEYDSDEEEENYY